VLAADVYEDEDYQAVARTVLSESMTGEEKKVMMRSLG
jgi:hypothetical protein